MKKNTDNSSGFFVVGQSPLPQQPQQPKAETNPPEQKAEGTEEESLEIQILDRILEEKKPIYQRISYQRSTRTFGYLIAGVAIAALVSISNNLYDRLQPEDIVSPNRSVIGIVIGCVIIWWGERD
jgi:hypothetical protein